MTKARGILDGKVALITGAGRGIGRDIALGFAGAGADLAIISRTEPQLNEVAAEAREHGSRVVVMAGDVSEESAVNALVSKTLEELGRIDILVNNAGVIDPVGPLWEEDPERWWRTIRIDFQSVFLCCRAVLPGMVQRGSGKVINLSGAGAGGAAQPRLSAYSSSKTALLRLTEDLAADLLPHNVQVNAVAPGGVDTFMMQVVKDAGPEKAGAKLYGEVTGVQDRHQSANEAIELCLFLASGESDFLTGRLIATRDKWRSLTAIAAVLEDERCELFKLRRVDGSWVSEVVNRDGSRYARLMLDGRVVECPIEVPGR